MSILRALSVAVATLAVGAACSDSATEPAVAEVQLQSVTPAGGATNVPTTATMIMQFSGAMMTGMEEYVMLHQGAGVAGPLEPIACEWSANQTTITCQPQGPLGPHMDYTLHLGGGMRDDAGHSIGMDDGYGMGGQMVGGGMMSGGMMGGGMMFTFRTE